ncbi:hypothetical protein PF005_g27071 [Phytophthora fragariae]|uniref:Uncharacterized protein n=1 Tax=Phytophthora fragariae TaxID=53985 RepID=A0A6A3VTH4_9STRA|nr:hypothetical protein PF003_g35058 [Phytophthora fragariae]KAE8921974.1 hypothetical protein PF009_g27753 [Phytophthora fragariae]KAE8971407.1 hypothetical protein PF011_g26045 [Phytophthora fragariae]KAE9070458.1 hypothetical protein PF010_g26263 [Phytophthora fragariae]KAE9074179.1 hypothetical protein PF007_g25516 [Phytophthora fragariae]
MKMLAVVNVVSTRHRAEGSARRVALLSVMTFGKMKMLAESNAGQILLL